jgi:DNA-binding transcriptional regulator YiaG
MHQMICRILDSEPSPIALKMPTETATISAWERSQKRPGPKAATSFLYS